MNINLKINKDSLSADKGSVVSGSKNYYTLTASFSSDWSGLDKFAVFPDYECSEAFDSENCLTIPEALIAERGNLVFGVIGKASDEEVRITTNLIKLRVCAGASEYDCSPPSPDDSATWETYIGKIAQKYIDELDSMLPLSSEDIGEGAITTDKIANGAVTEGKLDQELQDRLGEIEQNLKSIQEATETAARADVNEMLADVFGSGNDDADIATDAEVTEMLTDVFN